MAEPVRTVLICDDEPPLRELMKVTLGPGYRTVEAADVEAARALVHDLKPDLVLLDVMMPGGSGLDVLDEIRAAPELASTRVVVISAWRESADSEAAFAAGADAFLGKPFLVDELISVVELLLGSDA